MTRSDRLTRICRLSAALCVALALLPFAALPAVWAAEPLLRMVPVLADGPLPSLPFRLIGLAASLPPALTMAWGLLRLRRFFLRTAAGDRFSAAGAVDLRAFGAALLARAVLTPLSGAAVSVAATWERGAGERALTLSVSDAELGWLLVAGLVFAMSWTLSEAAEIARDQRLIV